MTKFNIPVFFLLFCLFVLGARSETVFDITKYGAKDNADSTKVRHGEVSFMVFVNLLKTMPLVVFNRKLVHLVCISCAGVERCMEGSLCGNKC